MFNSKLKGVGAATLDRAVSLIIGGAVLSGVVGGVTWLYKISEKDKFLNDLYVVSSGVVAYYSNTGFKNINYNSVRDAGFIPKNIDVSKIGTKKIVKSATQSKDIYNLRLENMTYDLCIASGQTQIQYLSRISTRGQTVASKDLPFFNPSKLGKFEKFCRQVERKRTITYTFRRP